jgi:hypothetical protein
MAERTVALLRPRGERGYSDTAALNDIHVILTTAEPDGSALAEIAEVVTRTGRPMVTARDIEISTTETALGWPVACAQAGDTSVFVRQEPAGPGLLVEITTKTAAEAGTLTIVLDGRTLHPAGLAAGDPVPASRA